MKVAVVTPIPTPYRDPFWNEVARQPGIELDVFYCSAGKGDRPWAMDWRQEYRAEILGGRNLAAWRGADASCYWNPGIVRRLKKGRYDAVIVGGYNHLTMWSAMRHCVKNRVPYFLMCETYRRDRRSGVKGLLKRHLVGWAVRHAAGLLPTGSLAEAYLGDYGAAPDRMVRIPNVPDVEALHARTRELREQKPALRGKHGLSELPVVLFVGRLIPKKRAGLLIRAFRQAEIDAQLVIVGSGPEQPVLEKLAAECGLADRVRFAGFAQPSEMPEWYALADLFVLPSSETWGVVVLEALASGLPVIVTDEVGCHPDVVRDLTGTVVPAGKEAALATALRGRVQSLNGPRNDPGAWLVEEFAYRRVAERLAERLRIVGATPRSPQGLPRPTGVS